MWFGHLNFICFSITCRITKVASFGGSDSHELYRMKLSCVIMLLTFSNVYMEDVAHIQLCCDTIFVY